MSLDAGDVAALDRFPTRPRRSGDPGKCGVAPSDDEPVPCSRAYASDRGPDSRGFAILMVGLPGAGKSTLARAVSDRLIEAGRGSVRTLDSEMFRAEPAANTNPNGAGRDVTIARLVVVAEEIVRAGGVAVCAAVAPLRKARDAARRRIEPWGRYLLIHLSTPLAVCEQRDRQALYRDARLGRIARLTGVTHDLEPPLDADLVVDTSLLTIEASTDLVMRRLSSDRLIG